MISVHSRSNGCLETRWGPTRPLPLIPAAQKQPLVAGGFGSIPSVRFSRATGQLRSDQMLESLSGSGRPRPKKRTADVLPRQGVRSISCIDTGENDATDAPIYGHCLRIAALLAAASAGPE